MKKDSPTPERILLNEVSPVFRVDKESQIVHVPISELHKVKGQIKTNMIALRIQHGYLLQMTIE